MRRREFIKRTIPAVAVIPAALKGGVLEEDKYGLVSVDGPQPYWLFRAYLDGEDVTARCRAANDIEGWADLWDREHNVALKRHYGEVVLVGPDA